MAEYGGKAQGAAAHPAVLLDILLDEEALGLHADCCAKVAKSLVCPLQQFCYLQVEGLS